MSQLLLSIVFCVILLPSSFDCVSSACYDCYVRDFSKPDETLISCRSEYSTIYCTPEQFHTNCTRQTVYSDGIKILDNNLTSLMNLVEQTPNVRGVKFYQRNLSSIDTNALKNICKWKKLDEVGMKNILLKLLPSHFLSECQRVIDLDLSQNAISEIAEDAFYNLLEVTWLDLSQTQLKTLHKNTFKPLLKLQVLRLNGNLFRTIDANLFYHNPELFAISLGNNDLRIIDRSFGMFNNKIRDLELNNNQFLESVQLIVLADKLELNVAGCNLKTLDVPPKVAKIYAMSNGMSSINFHSDNQLKYLDISNNSFTDMNNMSNMRSLENLRLLNIMYNGISDLDYTELYHLKELIVLAIDFNPKLHFLIAEMKKEMPSLSIIVVSSHGSKTEEQKQIIDNGKRHRIRVFIHPNASVSILDYGFSVGFI